MTEAIGKSWGSVQLEFDILSGSYSLKVNGICLFECHSEIHIDGQPLRDLTWSVAVDQESELVLRGEGDDTEWRLRFRRVNVPGVGTGIELRLSGKLNKGCRKVRLTPLCVPRFEADHILAERPFIMPVASVVDTISDYQVLLTRNRQTAQLSLPLTNPDPVEFTLQLKGHSVLNLRAVTCVSYPTVGEEIVAAPVRVLVNTDGHALMNNWVDTEKQDDKKLSVPLVGWNSWDYYGWAITEDDILANAEFIASDPVLSKHVKRIVIDDGWQYCYGEWEPNHHFPSGMDGLARRLNRMGFEAGIWLAPALIEPQCHLTHFHPEMLARGESDLPCVAYKGIGRNCFMLDPTHPKSNQFLNDLAARYYRQGYRFFKLDFLRHLLLARRFHNNQLARGKVFAALLTPMLQVLQGKAEILACNYLPTHGGEGINALRIVLDNRARWERIKRNAPFYAAQYVNHGKLWWNDLDFALCRGPETSEDPDLHKLMPNLISVSPDTPPLAPGDYPGLANASYNELIVHLSTIIIGGSPINLSDNLPRLNKLGLELARKMVQLSASESGIPLDLFTTSEPEKWLQKTSDGYRALIINWSERTAEKELRLIDHGISVSSVVDFWTGETVELTNGCLRRVLPPRSCLLVSIAR